MRTKTVTALSLALLLLAGPVRAQEQQDTTAVAEPLHYARVYADSAGASHFADEEVSFALVDYAPPAPPLSVSTPTVAAGVAFLSAPSGWFGDWHPAPRRQFVFVLIGTVEVEVSDGEVRRFGPGSFVLVEDTAGQGHITRMVGSEQAYLVAVPLGEQ